MTARKKPGPKTEAHVEGDMRPVALTLDDMTLRLLKVAGAGNLSRGVRAASRHWYADYQRGRAQPEDGKPPAGPLKALP